MGLKAVLADGDATAEEVAGRCELDVRGCQAVLDSLASFGLVEVVGPRYRAPASVGLVERSMESIPGRLRGEAPLVAYDQIDGASESYPVMAKLLAKFYGDQPTRAAALLQGGGPAVLDLGAGSAVWSLALARADDRVMVTAVDLPDVMATTRACVAAEGMDARYEFAGGDLFELSLRPRSFDLAIIGHVCHLFGETRNRKLLARVASALKAGGRIAIIDEPRGDMKRSRNLAMHDLSLFARTSEGRLHAFSTYASWLRESGFVDIERHDLSDAGEQSLILARRP